MYTFQFRLTTHEVSTVLAVLMAELESASITQYRRDGGYFFVTMHINDTEYSYARDLTFNNDLYEYDPEWMNPEEWVGYTVEHTDETIPATLEDFEAWCSETHIYRYSVYYTDKPIAEVLTYGEYLTVLENGIRAVSLGPLSLHETISQYRMRTKRFNR